VTGANGHRVQVRWQDLDALGHVNHVVVLTFLEEGRDAWLENRGISRDEYVVGRCTVTFNREIDPAVRAVTVHCTVGELGRSSLTTHERIVDEGGKTVVEAQFELVLWDRDLRGSRPITEAERASLQEVSA